MLGKIALSNWLRESNGVTNYPEQRGLVQGVGVNDADYLIYKDGQRLDRNFRKNILRRMAQRTPDLQRSDCL